MKRFMAWLFILGPGLILDPTSLRADDDKVQDVGAKGLTVEGKVEAASPKVKFEPIEGKDAELPAQLYRVRLKGGKRYKMTQDSTEIDSVLIVKDSADKQLAWDDDGGGFPNAMLHLNVAKDGVYKIYCASLKGTGLKDTGAFTLKISEAAAFKAREIKSGQSVKDKLGNGVKQLSYMVKLAKGKTYVIDMISADEKALDPYLILKNSNGKVLARDDDSGGFPNARITIEAPADGTYEIVATHYGTANQGEFTLAVKEKE
jgi:hypothetical protein